MNREKLARYAFSTAISDTFIRSADDACNAVFDGAPPPRCISCDRVADDNRGDVADFGAAVTVARMAGVQLGPINPICPACVVWLLVYRAHSGETLITPRGPDRVRN